MYYFTAKWCGPCQNFNKNDWPVMKKAGWVLDSEYKKGVHIVKVDIDDQPELYKKIMDNLPDDLKKEFKGTIPAFVVMKNGKAIALTEHYLKFTNLCDFFNNNVKANK